MKERKKETCMSDMEKKMKMEERGERESKENDKNSQFNKIT